MATQPRVTALATSARAAPLALSRRARGGMGRARRRKRVTVPGSEYRSLPECCENPREHRFGIPEHLVIPESNDFVSVRTQECASAPVLFRLGGVLAAIEFEDEAPFEATEIGDERPDRELASELCSSEPAAAQEIPELSFSLRGLASELPRTHDGGLGNRAVTGTTISHTFAFSCVCAFGKRSECGASVFASPPGRGRTRSFSRAGEGDRCLIKAAKRPLEGGALREGARMTAIVCATVPDMTRGRDEPIIGRAFGCQARVPHQGGGSAWVVERKNTGIRKIRKRKCRTRLPDNGGITSEMACPSAPWLWGSV